MISRSTDIKAAMRSRQRGFLMNPCRFASQPEPVLGGLWSACSIKKLFASYSGYCLKARRSSDNATLDVGFSGGLLDTAVVAAWAGGSSVFVERWYDQTGAGNDFSQTDTTRQARIFNVSSYDGCLYFDGVNDGMQSVNSSGGPISAATVAAKAWSRNSTGGIIIMKSSDITTKNGFRIYGPYPDVNTAQLICSDDGDYFYTSWHSPMNMTNASPWAVRFDRSLSAANNSIAWPKAWKAGESKSITFNVNGNNREYGATSPAFTDSKYYIGSDATGASSVDANLQSILIYHQNKDSQISEIIESI